MNKITLLNVDDFLNYDKLKIEKINKYIPGDTCNIYSPHNYQVIYSKTFGGGVRTLTKYHPTPKANNESKVFRAIVEEKIPYSNSSTLTISDLPYTDLATNNKNEMIREPFWDAGHYKYGCIGDDAWRGDGSVLLNQGLLNNRDNVRIRPVLKYDEPDEMLKYAISKMIPCKKFKNLGIIEYGYYPQNVIGEIAYSEDEIDGLSKYKTGNSFTITEKAEYSSIYCPTIFTKKDEYYIKGKRCILIPDYDSNGYNHYNKCIWKVFHPYMKEHIDKDKIVYHAREVSPIIWYIDLITHTMVATNQIIHGFPVGFNGINTDVQPDKVPDTVYTFLNDTFGKEMLQTYIPLRYKQTISEAQKKLNELMERLIIISSNYNEQLDNMKKQKPLQNEYEDLIKEVHQFVKDINGLEKEYIENSKSLVKKKTFNNQGRLNT